MEVSGTSFRVIVPDKKGGVSDPVLHHADGSRWRPMSISVAATQDESVAVYRWMVQGWEIVVEANFNTPITRHPHRAHMVTDKADHIAFKVTSKPRAARPRSIEQVVRYSPLGLEGEIEAAQQLLNRARRLVATTSDTHV